MRTRFWFRLHSFMGIVTGLLLFVVCWSGTFATLAHEIDWLLTPALRASTAQLIDIDAVERMALVRHPGATLQRIAWPLHGGYAIDVVLRTASASLRHEYVDPASHSPEGGTSYFNVQRFFRSLHMSLFLPFGVGIYIVGAAGVMLMISALTPLVFFKRWWTRAFQRPRATNRRTLFSELHKLTGLWSLWFVGLIAATGIWYAVEQLMIDVADVAFIYPPTPTFDGPAEPRLPLSHFLDAAKQLRPELVPRSIGIASNGLVFVSGQATEWLVRDRANTLYFDPLSAGLVARRDAGSLDALERWIEMVDLLHFGTFGGLATKLLWAILGLALAGLCLTGAYLHACRLAVDSTGRARWRGLIAVIGATVGLLGWSVSGAFAEARRLGPLVDGVRELAEVSAPMLSFVLGWSALTLLLLIGWMRMVVLRCAGQSRSPDRTNRQS